MAIKKIKLPDNTTEDINDSRLPAVTTTDNGKVLSVSGGIWSANNKPSYTLDEVTDGSTRSLANYQPLDADLTAIAGLSGTSGLLKKTDENTWSLDTNAYYYSGNANKSDVEWTCRSIVTGSYGPRLSSAGWYRFFTFNNAPNDAASVIIRISRTFSNNTSESYALSINITSNGNVTFTQISGYANTQLITKVRVDYTAAGASYVDLYYNGTAGNYVKVTATGDGTLSTPTAVSSLTGTEKAFNLSTNGISTSGNIETGDSITIPNNKSFCVKDSGGTAIGVVDINTNNAIRYGVGGRTSCSTYIYGKDISFYIGSTARAVITSGV